MAAAANNGIVNKPSKHSIEQTVDALTNILKSKGVAVFALIDHSGEAEKVGLKMRPTKYFQIMLTLIRAGVATTT